MEENKNFNSDIEDVKDIESEVVETENADATEPAEDNEPKYSTRSNIIWMLCGAYLVYTGYSLISGMIEGREGSTIGFAIVGGAFFIIGAIFAISGAKRWIDNDKKKRAEAEAAENEADNEPSALKRAWKASEKIAEEQQGKKLSISERANLVGNIDDDDLDIDDLDVDEEE